MTANPNMPPSAGAGNNRIEEEYAPESPHPLDKTSGRHFKPGNAFFVTRKTLEAILNAKLKAPEIAIFLTLARFTNKTGAESTAGFQAIQKNAGIGKSAAEKYLQHMHLVKVANNRGKQEPLAASALDLPLLDKNKRTQTRWTLGGMAWDDKVWFPNTLVDGYGRFQNPLRRLCRCGDAAARLLLLFYMHADFATYTGINPKTAACQKYEARLDTTYKGHNFFIVTASGPRAFPEIASIALGGTLSSNIVPAVFWSYLELLKSNGFIYEAIAICDDSCPLYFIHVKNPHGNAPPTGEEHIGGRIATVFSRLGKPLTETGGRFSGRFGAIVPDGLPIQAWGIYRLRLRTSVDGSSLTQANRGCLDWATAMLDNLDREMGYPKSACTS